MTWLAIRAFFGGALSGLWRWLSARSLAELALMALALFAVVQHFQLADARHDRNAWHRQFDSEHKGRLADRSAYIKAQAVAAILNEQQIAQRLQKQKANNDAQVSTLSRRLELIRSELRKPSDRTASSSADGTKASPGVESPCRVIDPAWMCLSPEDRLRAAENEERHDELIDLVQTQSK